MKLYLSSKMTDLPDNNEPAFYTMEKLLQDLGINPARLSKKVKKKNPGWVDFMRVDIKGLMDCEAVVCFGDYGNSKGSMLEQVIAKSLEIPIYRYDEIANKLYEPHHG